jgi:hypothetical protein
MKMNEINANRRRRVLDALSIEMNDASPREWEAMQRFTEAEVAENVAFDAADVPGFVARYRPRMEKWLNIPSPELATMTSRPAPTIAESADLKAAIGK